MKLLGQWFLVLAALAAIAPASTPAVAARKGSPVEPAPTTKVVVVVANRVILTDLLNTRLPTISRIISDGAVGLVSPNCVGLKTEFSVLLTASSGASCRGGLYVAECYDVNENLLSGELAGLAHARRTGARPRPGSAVFLGLAQSVRENGELGGLAPIGALGDALRKAGKRTCAIGNADIPPDIINRAAAVLAADSKGRIDVGRLRPHVGPGFQIPDQHGLAREAISALDDADFVVVNYGITTQLDDSKISISDEVYAKRWESAMRGLDALLADITASRRGRDAVLVLVSFSPPVSPRWSELTPIVIYPSRSRGLLISSSTRTPGLIAASDFAPTVLGLFDIRPAAPIYGLPARDEPAANKIAAIETLSERVTAKRILEYPMLWFFAGVGVVSYTLAAVAVGFPVLGRARKLLKLGILFSCTAPLAMLVASPAPEGAAGYALATALALIFAIAVGWRIGQKSFAKAGIEGRPPMRAVPLIFVFWVTAVAILIDSALGGNLCKFSLPSSYQISGYRFYGIGNEYAGMLISMTAIALIFSSKAVRSKAVLPAGLLVAVFLGSSPLGANYGETIAAVVCFGLLWQAVRRGGFRGRHVIAWLAIALCTGAAFAVADWKLAGAGASHAGRAGQIAGTLGQSYWLDLIARKLILNFKLICSNTAEKTFLLFVPFMALWLGKLQPKVRQMFAGDGAAIAGLKAVVVGAVVAFALNDSGVVTASIIISMTAGALLYAGLEEAEWEGS